MQLLGIKTTKYKRTTFIVTPAKKDIISTSFPSQAPILLEPAFPVHPRGCLPRKSILALCTQPKQDDGRRACCSQSLLYLV